MYWAHYMDCDLHLPMVEFFQIYRHEKRWTLFVCSSYDFKMDNFSSVLNIMYISKWIKWRWNILIYVIGIW